MRADRKKIYGGFFGMNKKFSTKKSQCLVREHSQINRFSHKEFWKVFTEVSSANGNLYKGSEMLVLYDR